MSTRVWLSLDAHLACKLCIVQHLFVPRLHAPVSIGTPAGVGDACSAVGIKEGWSQVRGELWMLQVWDISTTHNKSKGHQLHHLSQTAAITVVARGVAVQDT